MGVALGGYVTYVEPKNADLALSPSGNSHPATRTHTRGGKGGSTPLLTPPTGSPVNGRAGFLDTPATRIFISAQYWT